MFKAANKTKKNLHREKIAGHVPSCTCIDFEKEEHTCGRDFSDNTHKPSTHVCRGIKPREKAHAQNITMT